MRLGLLVSIIMVLPLGGVRAQELMLDFVPESAQFDDAAAEYHSIWAADGARIVDALERLTDLRFAPEPVEAIVYEGTSFSGYRDLPMRMRASYPRSTKQATLVHELGHRLISDLVPATFEDHPIIFLFVYDAWVELWGREFADGEVLVEGARRGPSNYAATWRDVLALTAEERARKFREFLVERQAARSPAR